MPSHLLRAARRHGTGSPDDACGTGAAVVVPDRGGCRSGCARVKSRDLTFVCQRARQHAVLWPACGLRLRGQGSMPIRSGHLGEGPSTAGFHWRSGLKMAAQPLGKAMLAHHKYEADLFRGRLVARCITPAFHQEQTAKSRSRTTRYFTANATTLNMIGRIKGWRRIQTRCERCAQIPLREMAVQHLFKAAILGRENAFSIAALLDHGTSTIQLLGAERDSDPVDGN